MNQLNQKSGTSAISPQATTKAIAQEFMRIARLSEKGNGDEAWQAANELYAKHPNDPTANFIIAHILEKSGQKADALQYAEVAVKHEPENARYLVFLGKLYVDLGMIELALPILNKAFTLDKSIYQAPWALAVYYFNSGQGDRALPYFDLALKSAPEASRADIIYDRAQNLSAIGRIDEAESGFRNVMELPKYRIHALTMSALLKKNDHNSEYAARIREELELPDLEVKDRSRLFLCLGRLHENGRDYDNAFLNFQNSRELLKSDFDLNEFISRIEDNRAVFRREVFEKFGGFGHPTDKPIFIIGMPRSGTTMTEQIIASHSQAEGVGELDRMGRMAAGISRRRGMQQIVDKMAEVGPDLWKDVPLQYLRLVNVLAPDARRTVDKMPHNFMTLGFIHLCFPNARIIHCRRNPLDCFISAYQNSMSSFHGYSYEQTSYGEYYIRYLQMMDHWKSALPSNIYESHYEKLTANPEAEVRSMLNFLELPWEDACLKFNERESTVKTLSLFQVREPINTASVARWRKYEKHLGPIREVLQKAGVAF